MELRYGEVDRARAIFERYVKCVPSVKAWVRYAKFEMKSGGDVAAARVCYERAVEELGEDANNVGGKAAVWGGSAMRADKDGEGEGGGLKRNVHRAASLHVSLSWVPLSCWHFGCVCVAGGAVPALRRV
jgi:hypothetical protein